MRYSSNGIKLAVVLLFALACVCQFAVTRAVSFAQRQGPAPSSIFQPTLPQGIPLKLWQRLIPSDNPLTVEKVSLGRMLYFDKRLSADGTLSCANCHDPATAFAGTDALAIGVGGRPGTRNAPTILNAMFNESQFWDGRARSLEEQAQQPLTNRAEMGMKGSKALIARLSAIPEYERQFRQAFADEGITMRTIAKAIASFERTQLSGNSPFDRFISGDERALTEPQKRGWSLFQGKARCITCHSFNASMPFFTDFQFHNTGVAAGKKGFEPSEQILRQLGAASEPGALNNLAHTSGLSDLGRYLVTKRAGDIGAFKTPTLRDVELTSPYMHDASEKTLLDVLKFYNRGGEPNAHLDERMRPLNLTAAEMGDLIEFMRSLTSDDVMRQSQNSTPQNRIPSRFN